MERASKSGTSASGTCDKCDGPHTTEGCPHFRGKTREKHRDAWVNYGKKGAGDPGENVSLGLDQCAVVTQPGDGSCLYHSLAFGLRGVDASKLRRDIADFVAQNPSLSIADTPLSDWVSWDSGGSSASAYAAKMGSGSRWGGGIEMAACSKLHNVEVHVYQRNGNGYQRISTFNSCGKYPKKCIHVIYEGKCHYNALEIRGA